MDRAARRGQPERERGDLHRHRSRDPRRQPEHRHRLNARGDVVGWSTLAGDTTRHAFLYQSRSGRLIDPDPLCHFLSMETLVTRSPFEDAAYPVKLASIARAHTAHQPSS
jgi:probable HAF family extracellular repeat protein